MFSLLITAVNNNYYDDDDNNNNNNNNDYEITIKQQTVKALVRFLSRMRLICQQVYKEPCHRSFWTSLSVISVLPSWMNLSAHVIIQFVAVYDDVHI
jgi:hypothetical protein